MPIGYVVGKQYRLDTNYDRYAGLAVWSRILREASQRGFSLDVKYSHLGRNYSAEVSKMDKIKENWFMFSRALKHEANPLSAMIAALIAADVTDPLMSALYLEGEIEALRVAWSDAKERDARRDQKVNWALNHLAASLELASVKFSPPPQPIPAAPDEDDDL